MTLPLKRRSKFVRRMNGVRSVKTFDFFPPSFVNVEFFLRSEGDDYDD
jgi:hypothetical protein